MRAEAARELLRRRRARHDFGEFMKFVWWKPVPYAPGRHHRALWEICTRAVDNFLNDISTHAVVLMPNQHGKSTHLSIGFPAYCLGRLAHLQPNTLMTGYGASLVGGFSLRVRELIRSRPYRALFPEVQLDAESRCQNETWRPLGWSGEYHAAGLHGGLTGHGCQIGAVDDYCKNPEEANSPTFHEKNWEQYTAAFRTRLGDPCIEFVIATPWDESDLVGRIRREMEEKPDFPQFEFFVFPYKDEKGRYLWPEFYSPEWYEGLKASLGWRAAAILGCDPKPRSGTIFDVEKFQYHNDLSEFPEGRRRARIWDLASTEKQVGKPNPDFTCGPLGSVTYDSQGRPQIWVEDVEMGQWGTTRRNRRILATHERDPGDVEWGIEGIGGYKDTLEEFKDLLEGKRLVRAVPVPGDKYQRIAHLEPVVDAGNFHLLRASWNEPYVDQFRTYPRGKDDGPDSTAALYHRLRRHHGRGVCIWRAA